MKLHGWCKTYIIILIFALFAAITLFLTLWVHPGLENSDCNSKCKDMNMMPMYAGSYSGVGECYCYMPQCGKPIQVHV